MNVPISIIMDDLRRFLNSGYVVFQIYRATIEPSETFVHHAGMKCNVARLTCMRMNENFVIWTYRLSQKQEISGHKWKGSGEWSHAQMCIGRIIQRMLWKCDYLAL